MRRDGDEWYHVEMDFVALSHRFVAGGPTLFIGLSMAIDAAAFVKNFRNVGRIVQELDQTIAPWRRRPWVRSGPGVVDAWASPKTERAVRAAGLLLTAASFLILAGF
jgi:hypothetical protein